MPNFDARMDGYRLLVEDALDHATAYDESLLQGEVIAAMRYSLLGGGKRIRAVLALEFCRSLSGDCTAALPAACSLEMVHAYSLIHDDLPCMDDDDMRRGKPSCHKKFGEATALLAGDGLLTLAFKHLSSYSTIRQIGAERAIKQINALSSAAGEYGMLGGQTIDVLYSGRVLDASQHSKMVSMKTGALIRAAVLCGCIAAQASDETTFHALRYAAAVGEAFQITDDILDVSGSADITGKPVGSDARSHKNTYVEKLGLEGAKNRADQLFDEARTALAALDLPDRFLFELTDSLSRRDR